MQYNFIHPYGNNITNVLVDKIFPNLDSDEVDDEFEEDETEGIVYVVELLDDDIFKDTPIQEKIKEYIIDNGFDYESQDEYSDTEWAGQLYIRLNYKLEWDEKKLVLDYYNSYFYLLESNQQVDIDLPDNFKYYVQDLLEKNNFVLSYKTTFCDCNNSSVCNKCLGTKTRIVE